MLTDNMSWIAGYKCKKEEVQQDYEEIIKMLTQMNFEKSNPHEWNIEISTHKIRMKGTLENYGMIIKKPQQEAKNIVLSTLSNYVIVYTNWNTNSSHLFYSSIDEAQNEMPNFYPTKPNFIQFLEVSSSIQKPVQVFKIEGLIFQLGDNIIKVGLYKKGMANNIIIQFELKSIIFRKKSIYELNDNPYLKDFINFINFDNFKEKLIYRRLSPELSKYFENETNENNFSLDVENLLEIIEFILI